MKKYLQYLLLCILPLGSMVYAHQETLDKIAAIVNEDIVTTSELKQAMALMKLQMQQQAPAEKKLQETVLTQLINKKLQLQLAKQANIEASAPELDRAIENIAKQNNMTANELYSRLEQDGMSKKTYRKELQEQITLNKLQQQQVARRMQITKQEIEAYRANRNAKRTALKSYHVEDILFPAPEEMSDEQLATLKKQAQVAIGYLKNSTNTPKLKAFLKKHHAETQDLGFKRLEELPSLFASNVGNLKKGDVSEPIVAGNGIHILKMTDYKTIESGESQLSNHDIESILMQNKFESAVQNWLSKVRAQAFIQVKDQNKNA